MNGFLATAAAIGAALVVALLILIPVDLGTTAPEPDPAPPAYAQEGAPAFQREQPEPSAPTVFFANLTDGARVTSPVAVEFGLVGMMVMPAGEVVEGTGHHHLLINTTLDDAMLGMPLPADDRHIHFGGGQKRTTVDLPPGRHTLQLVMADGNHVPHEPAVTSAPITITVLAEPRGEMGVESRTRSWLMGRRAY